MDILGVGPLELLLILVIALIVLGPKDMVKAGRTLGKFMRKIVTSPTWHAMQDTSRQIRSLPNKLIRDAGLDEIQEQLPKKIDFTAEIGKEHHNQYENKSTTDISDWITPQDQNKNSELETSTSRLSDIDGRNSENQSKNYSEDIHD